MMPGRSQAIGAVPANPGEDAPAAAGFDALAIPGSDAPGRC